MSLNEAPGSIEERTGAGLRTRTYVVAGALCPFPLSAGFPWGFVLVVGFGFASGALGLVVDFFGAVSLVSRRARPEVGRSRRITGGSMISTSEDEGLGGESAAMGGCSGRAEGVGIGGKMTRAEP